MSAQPLDPSSGPAVVPDMPVATRRRGRPRKTLDERDEGNRRQLIIDGAVTPIAGKDRDSDTVISNSEYWIAPEIIVAKSDKSRMRAFGRNWNFAGRSAEICKLDWRGP